MNATRILSALAGLQLLAVEFSQTATAMELGKDFDLVFATSRKLLREQICTTPSAQTVVLR